MLATVWWGQADAQRIIRSTFCGTGGTVTNNTATLRSTFGQCPGCGSISSPAGTIYPGFQQPVDSETIENEVPCFASDFAVEMITTDCGEYYSFEYLGTADQTTATFTWDFGNNGLPQSATVANPLDIAFSAVGNQLISLTVSQDTCTETVRKSINVSAVGFGGNPVVEDVLCFGDNDGRIELEIAGGEEPFSVIWADGSTTAIRRDLMPGDYAVTATDARNCEFSTVVTVATPDSLVVDGDATNESTAGAADGSILTTVSGGTMPYTFLWEDGSVAQNRQNLVSGIYIVTVTDANNCTASDTLDFSTLEGGAGIEVVIDDVFTPNGDNINDEWTIEDIDKFPNNEILIYNRWGQLVYGVTGYNNTWLGTNTDGEDLQTGAYWYIIKLNDENDIQLSGVVTIVR